jgi:hypothetical protein
MARQGDGAHHFLTTVREREAALIDGLFDDSAVACETKIALLVGQAR